MAGECDIAGLVDLDVSPAFDITLARQRASVVPAGRKCDHSALQATYVNRVQKIFRYSAAELASGVVSPALDPATVGQGTSMSATGRDHVHSVPQGTHTHW